MFWFAKVGVSAFCGNISRSSAFEAKVVIKASLLFFLGEFFNVDGVYIHGVGVFLLLGVVVVLVVLEGKEWVSLFFGDFVGFFPDVFKVEHLCEPLLHSVWDSVHSVDSLHELGGDSLCKEVD